jgi:hypothetical protein
VPVQPVDATPSNALIRRNFAGRTHLFDCTRSNPNQGSVLVDLTLAGDFVFVFNAGRVRPKCCVDPLNAPGKSDTSPVTPFYERESQGKSFPGDWKEQRS